jgi:hypothetical protein
MDLSALPIDKPAIRSLDDNSLWRLLDETQKIDVAVTQLERERVRKARDRVTDGLRKRGARIRVSRLVCGQPAELIFSSITIPSGH